MTIKIFVNSTNKQSFVQAIIYLLILLRLKDDKIELFFYSNNISEPLNNLIKKIDDLKKLLISSNEYENIFDDFFGFEIEIKEAIIHIPKIQSELKCLFNTEDKDMVEQFSKFNKLKFVEKELTQPNCEVIFIEDTLITLNNLQLNFNFNTNLERINSSKSVIQRIFNTTIENLDGRIHNSIRCFQTLIKCRNFIQSDNSCFGLLNFFSKTFSQNFNDIKDSEKKEHFLKILDNIIDFVFIDGYINEPGLKRFLGASFPEVKLTLNDDVLKTKLISHAKDGNSFLQCVYKTVGELGYLK